MSVHAQPTTKRNVAHYLIAGSDVDASVVEWVELDGYSGRLAVARSGMGGATVAHLPEANGSGRWFYVVVRRSGEALAVPAW